MHDDELELGDAAAEALIRAQFPEWSGEHVRRLPGAGTVNAIYRIGTGMAARFPLRRADAGEARRALEREGAAMVELAACSPVPTPQPLAIGEPGLGYPLPWSVQTWVPGDTATPHGLAHSATFARDLAALIRALHSADTRGRTFDGAGRGGDLRDGDAWMQTCFRESEGLLDVPRLRSLWASLRDLPRLAPDAMTHGDLIPGNLLVQGEYLVGVVDGGGFKAADPALDLVAAWHLLDAGARTILRGELQSDDLGWARGAAWAFQQAMGLVWYYRTSNPVMSALGRSTLDRLFADFEV
ncbi:aminoglycoside phosphotransferase (APT) family kinase protein [Diaminobutyricimonas aerilata]|uniref:Aminoglycoside phosphotransferase (APT) family kinase protein n=1 Tax=Diaminobutyricimonas aerilata TaxID=1162967 RepID=A0A2M9CF21_9MICO|nr:aminoglycoside phosphotransferase family protein [Diaminobutyricimonas aerilata]PJJ70493.1 aminoglycoside phosphotransferase (APT) family kinase protein [Diaminobutyricimonas aerilata]